MFDNSETNLDLDSSSLFASAKTQFFINARSLVIGKKGRQKLFIPFGVVVSVLVAFA